MKAFLSHSNSIWNSVWKANSIQCRAKNLYNGLQKWASWHWDIPNRWGGKSVTTIRHFFWRSSETLKCELDAVTVEAVSLPEHHTMPFSPWHAPLIRVKDVFYKKQSSLPLISPYYGSVTSNALSLASALSMVEKNPSSTLAPAVRKGEQQPTLSATDTWGRMIVRSEFYQSCKTTPLLQAGESHRASSWAQLCSGSVCCRRDRDKPTELHNSQGGVLEAMPLRGAAQRPLCLCRFFSLSFP